MIYLPIPTAAVWTGLSGTKTDNIHRRIAQKDPHFVGKGGGNCTCFGKPGL
jgi:hypothetical protein